MLIFDSSMLWVTAETLNNNTRLILLNIALKLHQNTRMRTSTHNTTFIVSNITNTLPDYEQRCQLLGLDSLEKRRHISQIMFVASLLWIMLWIHISFFHPCISMFQFVPYTLVLLYLFQIDALQLV